MKVEEILAERQATHGNYSEVASISQRLKSLMRHGPERQWASVADDQRESLDLIATKLARLLCGDPNHVDTWRDIAGYATLVADRLEADAKITATPASQKLPKRSKHG